MRILTRSGCRTGITVAAVTFGIALALLPARPQPVTTQKALVAAIDPALLEKPAKQVFGAIKEPIPLEARAIGSYARGCLAGGQPLPVNGSAWQVMRTSRNRNWAHPALISLIEMLANDAKTDDGWNGLLVGDIAQPRGGPMLTDHASHQIGLDADVWFTPMPDHPLTDEERETMVPREMVKDRKTIDPDAWGEAQARLVKRAASYPEVARIFVNPPIKAELCKWATGDRSWLAKVRPYYGHTFHFHIRIACPKGSPQCENQPVAAPKDGTGCSDELAYWIGDKPWYWMDHHKNQTPTPRKGPPLSKLPAECRQIAVAP
jgi:penicillin-insensitive murein endopeptidase